jgi:hypothetical protein
MEREMERVIAELSSSNREVRAAAARWLKKRGRLAAPILARILDRTKSEQSRALISKLMANQS